jgi:hypothetical protein
VSEIAVHGILIKYATTADGGLRLTIELDELQAALFQEGFKGINYTVAVARLGEGENEGK